MQLFEVGRYYILDELADDIISDRAAKCLDYAANNVLYCLLAEYLAGKTGGFNTYCFATGCGCSIFTLG